jgi:hypothetical protein
MAEIGEARGPTAVNVSQAPYLTAWKTVLSLTLRLQLLFFSSAWGIELTAEQITTDPHLEGDPLPHVSNNGLSLFLGFCYAIVDRPSCRGLHSFNFI